MEGDLCIVSRGGRWIDCDNSFNGFYLSDHKYEIEFSSSFDSSSLNMSGRAFLTLIDGNINWKLLTRPNVIDDKYYAPIKSLLIKKKVRTIGVIVKDEVFLYSGPSESKAHSIRLSDGDVVYIDTLNESKTWYKVEYNGHIGWIKKSTVISN
ncbi:SH3 domain-containing protein [Vibrio sp.]|uniref:SH3 domain-containing protein n=1 Tax=Vibrio sp. TaxID=678 RepID=UPI003AA8C42B